MAHSTKASLRQTAALPYLAQEALAVPPVQPAKRLRAMERLRLPVRLSTALEKELAVDHTPRLDIEGNHLDHNPAQAVDNNSPAVDHTRRLPVAEACSL